VIVVGAVNVDFVVVADTLPAPGETVVGPGLERHGGGKGANAAVAASRAGADVWLLGAVGADDTAAFAQRELREAGVELSGVAELKDESTGVALIVVDRHGENQIAVGAGANAALRADWVSARMDEALPTADCVLVSTEIPGPAVAAAVRAATAAGVPCVLNTAPPIPAVLELLDQGAVLTPNVSELAALTAMLGEEEDEGTGDGDDAGSEDQARRLAERTGAPLVVTLGGEGALVVSPDGTAQQFRPPAAEVRDTTGAGDTFNGVLATRLAAGDELGEAVAVAVLAASLSVSHVGARTGMPGADAIEAARRTALDQIAG
jgi:ribokinase